MNPALWVVRHASRRPDQPALAVGERVHASWRELARRTAGVAGGLRDEHRLLPGDRVAVVMRNRAEYLEALLATWHAGLVAGIFPRRHTQVRETISIMQGIWTNDVFE